MCIRDRSRLTGLPSAVSLACSTLPVMVTASLIPTFFGTLTSSRGGVVSTVNERVAVFEPNGSGPVPTASSRCRPSVSPAGVSAKPLPSGCSATGLPSNVTLGGSLRLPVTCSRRSLTAAALSTVPSLSPLTSGPPLVAAMVVGTATTATASTPSSTVARRVRRNRRWPNRSRAGTGFLTAGGGESGAGTTVSSRGEVRIGWPVPDTVSRPRHAATLPRRALPAHPVPAAGGWRACRRARGALRARSGRRDADTSKHHDHHGGTGGGTAGG